jgi:hypothetical protein
MTNPTTTSAPPNGSAWAALLAAGIGCFTFGLFVDLAEAFPKFSSALNFYNPVGDLSGKSILAVAVWLIFWAMLHSQWKSREIASTRILAIVILALVLIGQLAVFPPFFELFAH